ncbi:Uncharacterised protein [Mycobacteroides abscessus subsp. abscessus]|nr:Uncharacterised protein [Mycobacteroides abscessus subsp. abscessus]
MIIGSWSPPIEWMRAATLAPSAHWYALKAW